MHWMGKITKALIPFWISTSYSRMAILAHRAHTDRSSGLGAATWLSVTVAMVFVDAILDEVYLEGSLGYFDRRVCTLYLCCLPALHWPGPATTELPIPDISARNHYP